MFVTVYSGVTLNRDLATGAFDRFRSMPIWRPAPIVGALLGDLGRYLLAAGLVIGLGFAMGYDASGGALAAVALVLLFASALSWVWIALGMLLRSPTAVMNLGFGILFPLTFLSNIFVAPKTMPGWLHKIADGNPVSHLVSAARALMSGHAAGAQVLWVIAAAGLLGIIVAPLAWQLYRRHG